MSGETGTGREAAILLWCARQPIAGDLTGEAPLLPGQPIDWDALLALSLRHKVMPLLYRRLKAGFAEIVPPEFMERLRDYFYLNAARNHLLTEELCRVLQLFETGGIRAVSYKGPLLAAQLYGDVALRQFNDLDIMVRRADVQRASALLRTRGLREEHPLTEAETAALLKVECEQMFFREEGRIYLDLHWGFAPHYFPFRLDAESIWQRLTSSSLQERQVLTFSQEDLLLILCINAGKEFWPQLSNLCDISALIGISTRLDWERLISEAESAGVRRMFFVSLRLAHELLGASVPEEIARRIASDKEVGSLALRVRQQLFRREEARGRGVAGFLKPAQALDGRGARAIFHLRLALTPTLEDWTYINWPKPFRFLYYLTRPLRLAGKYLLHPRKPVT